MKLRLLPLLILISLVYCNGQTTDFDLLIKHFKKNLEYDTVTVNPPMIYQGSDYVIRLDNFSLGLTDKRVEINSPNENSDFPVSFSVIYRDNIVSLFEPGVFVCHKLSDFSRNYEFENILNTKQFDYHWLIDNKLHAISKGRYWYLDAFNQWKRLNRKLPFDKQPKLFENQDYLAYCDCHGEWGGTVYFFNKKTQKVYFTEATCANSIIENENGYIVLSHLGHIVGSAELKLIKDPMKLTKLRGNNKSMVNGSALGYTDKTNQTIKLFDYWGLQIYSSFMLKGMTYYIVYWQLSTFLAKIEDDNIIIVDPLFNIGFTSDDPITIQYEDNLVLMNLDSWGSGRERETAIIIISEKEIVRLNWKKNTSANTAGKFHRLDTVFASHSRN